MELLKFKKSQFATDGGYSKGWHLMNEYVAGGEYTLCGIAFDGDAHDADAEAEKKNEGKVTCEDCLSIIRMCKKIKL